jgi:transposase
MGKKEMGTKREYTEEFKVETVRLAESIGGNAAASRLGIPQSTVTNWVRRRKGMVPSTQASSVAAKRPMSELEAENMRLRRELTNAKLDLDIVKKAAAYFVRESR